MGKSLIAHRLAARLGCRSVVEEWCPALPLVPGGLHLTSEEVAA